MRAHIGMVTAGVILFLAGNLPATIVELPLDCAGTYTVGQNSPADSWSTYFDFGVEFTEISHVYIEWEGEITASQAIYIDNPNNPLPVDCGISAVLGEYPSWRHITFPGGETTYPEPEYFNLRIEFPNGSLPLSELCDGQEKITISYTVFLLTQRIYVDYGTVTLNKAMLQIDGTVIPEPTTILFLAIGAIGVRLRGA